MIHGEAKMLRRHEVAACPAVLALRELVARATGVERGAQKRLAELVSVRRETISKWVRGAPVPHTYVARLIEVEANLRARVEALERPARAERSERPLPLMANVVDVRVEGEQALLRFALKVPGEDAPRTVAEVLVPQVALATIRPTDVGGRP